jgi:predicted O-methyltransferase YrrM
MRRGAASVKRAIDLARRLVVSVRRHGFRATRVALGAKRRGAKQKLVELAGLIALVAEQKPRVVLEIGSLHGGTLWAWCRVARRDAVITSVDLPSELWEGDPRRWHSFARGEQTLTFVRSDSHHPSTSMTVRDNFGGHLIDFLFIDGDHSYEGVRNDFETYSEMVAEGGVVALHDVVDHPRHPDCQVHVLWRELTAAGRGYVEFVETREERDNWGGIGVLLKP